MQSAGKNPDALKYVKHFTVVLRQDVREDCFYGLVSAVAALGTDLAEGIDWYFLPDARSDIFRHFMFMLAGHCAVISNSISGAPVASPAIVRDRQKLALLENEYCALLEQCTVIPVGFISGKEPYSEGVYKFVRRLNQFLSGVFNDALYHSFADLLTDLSAAKSRSDMPGLDASLLYNYKALFVSDAHGIARRCCGDAKNLWDLTADEIIGRNAADIERSGHFAPSITRLVLEKHRRVYSYQRTKTGRNLMVLGVPIIDRKGGIRQIINLSSDVTKEG